MATKFASLAEQIVKLVAFGAALRIEYYPIQAHHFRRSKCFADRRLPVTQGQMSASSFEAVGAETSRGRSRTMVGGANMVRRRMRLTEELVSRVPPHLGDSGKLAGRADLPTDVEYVDAVAEVLEGAPPSGDVWIFAYGSLIWNPGFEHVEERLGTVSGWRRSFCQGWVRIYRGTPDRPGIMLALDRGGACRGVVFRLAPEAVRENLMLLLRRERPIRWETLGVRWVTARTDAGPVRALAFPISRSNASYLPDLTEDVVVEALATAGGERGSMAEYLRSTVEHLEARGIHDRYLWRMQERVAARLEYGPPVAGPDPVARS